MAKTKQRDIVIDPHFFVPPGVVDVRQEAEGNAEFFYDTSTQAAPSGIPSTTTADIPSLPASYSIFEQRVRISADGTSVVDVTLDFPDTTGVYSIDVQVTKA